MRILLTGADGQLGTSLRKISPDFPEHEFLFTDVSDLDVCSPRDTEKVFSQFRPECIINCASYNAVDKAEDDPEAANSINTEAAGLLARQAREWQSGLIHLSTDYIFDGRKGQPYNEQDEPNPRSNYAMSKWLGEKAVAAAGPSAAIIRTSWLYSEYGHNFVKTIRRLGAERDEISVVDDQFGSPTYAGDLALAIMKILPHVRDFGGIRTYHYSNEGATHWAGFAEAILEYSSLDCSVKHVSTAEYGLSKAERPAYSLLDKSLVKKDFGLDIPTWQDSLEICIKNLENNK